VDVSIERNALLIHLDMHRDMVVGGGTIFSLRCMGNKSKVGALPMASVSASRPMHP
jgi:hypothetical protein